jgi:hypothetical protein
MPEDTTHQMLNPIKPIATRKLMLKKIVASYKIFKFTFLRMFLLNRNGSSQESIPLAFRSVCSHHVSVTVGR